MYIDPNSGGMLFQALLVVFGLISGTVFIFSSKIKMTFARLMRSIREKDGENEELGDPGTDIETE